MNTSEQEVNQAIEELKELILTLAYHNSKDSFICEECIDTIHKLLAILTQLTGNTNEEFAKEIYNIIGYSIR